MFDLGGVLIENRGRERLTAMLPSPLDHNEIWSKWLSSPSVRSFERGMISPGQFASAFVEEWQIGLEPTAFLQAFETWPKGLYDGAEELLQHLKASHHLACLSNTNEIHWRQFPQLSMLFDSCFLSHEIGRMKPDRAVFEYALEHLDADPQSIYFFDDLLVNVNAAREVGMRAFHVESFSGIEPILHRENLYDRSFA